MDLSSIAHQLDEEERMRMAEGGMASEEYRTFLQVWPFDCKEALLSIAQDRRHFVWQHLSDNSGSYFPNNIKKATK